MLFKNIYTYSIQFLVRNFSNNISIFKIVFISLYKSKYLQNFKYSNTDFNNLKLTIIV